MVEPIQLKKALSDVSHFSGLLPELDELLELSPLIGEFGSLKILGEVRYGDHVFPLLGVVLGTLDKSAPTFSVCAGVHGLERIGGQVTLSYLRTFLNFLQWDKSTQDTLRKSRLVFFPIVNPVGMYGFLDKIVGYSKTRPTSRSTFLGNSLLPLGFVTSPPSIPNLFFS